MNIQDAIKSDIDQGVLPDKNDQYCLIVDGVPLWYSRKTHYLVGEVSGKEVLRNDWESYNNEEIRPEEKEVWESPSTAIFIVEKYDGILYFTTPSSCCKGKAVTHKCSEVWNNNGWKLLYSPDIEDVERIEIEGVEWRRKEINNNVYFYPVSVKSKSKMSYWEHLELTLKPPMKMILEIPKDKL